MSNLVSDAMVEAALAYLSQNTQASAKAKADRVMAELQRKRVLAGEIMASDQSSYAMKEAEATASAAYAVACEAERMAVETDEYHKACRVKADALIEAWRTEQSNIRSAEKIR